MGNLQLQVYVLELQAILLSTDSKAEQQQPVQK